MEQVDQIAVGLGAAGLLLGLVGVGWAATLQRRLARLQRAQSAVLGDDESTDLVLHAKQMADQVGRLAAYVKGTTEQTQQRLGVVEGRLDGTISHSGLVRYDAYNEM